MIHAQGDNIEWDDDRQVRIKLVIRTLVLLYYAQIFTVPIRLLSSAQKQPYCIWPCHAVSINVSLSMIVLNSRDWSEIIWLLEISCLKNQPCNRLYPKKPTGIHWLGYNDAVSWLKQSKNSNISAYSQF